MASRLPLVSIGGILKELPSADTLPLSIFGSQSANLVNASPNGSSGNPTFRALVPADIPNLPATKITSGLTNTRVPFFNGTSLVDDGNLNKSGAILSVGAASGSGEIRSYQIGGDVYYVAVKTASGKSGIFRSNTDFFVYYDTNTGETVLDATFSGAPNILFNILGTNKGKIDSSGFLTIGTARFLGYTQSSSNPSTSDYPNNKDWGFHKETLNGKIFLSYNLSGSILKVELT